MEMADEFAERNACCLSKQKQSLIRSDYRSDAAALQFLYSTYLTDFMTTSRNCSRSISNAEHIETNGIQFEIQEF